MATKKSTARNPARTDEPITRDQALTVWYQAKKSGAFSKALPHVQVHFELDQPWIPLMDLPRPKPCPFCGKLDNHIELNEHDVKVNAANAMTARVVCGHCGAEAPQGRGERSYDAIREAAYLWNRREGGES
jgi:Lar family restriction alleviation protein